MLDVLSKSIVCIMYVQFGVEISKETIKIQYFGKNGIDYCFYGSNKLVELIKQHKNNIEYNPKQLEQFLENKLNDSHCKYYFLIFVNDFALNFSFTSQHVSNVLKNMYLNYNPFKKENNIIVVDFSSPNIAKDMHVGHLRSTIIGDSVCNLLEKMGNIVYRTNHLGDYGTPVGKVIQYIIENPHCLEQKNYDLQQIYVYAKLEGDNNKEFLMKSHENVLKLQQNDPTIMEYYNKVKELSNKNFNDIYDKLNIKLINIGESFYGDKIRSMIDELEIKGLVKKYDGMLIMSIKNYNVPLILIKSNGSYTYDTTDLAAIRYRLLEIKADEIYYVIDSGQTMHMKMIFEAAKMAGWLTVQKVKHINFGVVLGDDGKKIKSREGVPFKLVNLLEQAVIKSEKIYDVKNQGKSQLIDYNKNEIIKNIGIGAIKYFDLKTERTANYKFSLDHMLSLNGNSIVYILYMYVRLNAIINKTKNKIIIIDDYLLNNFAVSANEELELGKHLIGFEQILMDCRESMLFNKLCNYLYKLTRLISDFYNNCRCINYNVDNNEIIDINYNSLILVKISMNVMNICFDILGIKGINKM